MAAGILFVLALASGIPFRVVTGVTSSTTSSLETSTTNINSSIPYSDSSSYYTYYGNHPDYPDCNSSDPLYWIGDGLCDTSLNTASCGWDGGDCCVCTCTSVHYSECVSSYDGYCEDPLAPLYLEDAGCTNAPLQTPEVPRCHQDRVELVVDSTASAMELANATLCSGGNFTVEWKGKVYINETIHVLNGTHLNITGISNAEADGGGTVRLFSVDNGFLYLNAIRIVNGFGSEGGAIILAANSELFADDVVFSSNTAHNVGGAVFSETSAIELMSTTFDANSASYGGAIFLHSSDMVGRGNISFINNTVSENGGALYIMEDSRILLDSRYGNDTNGLDCFYYYYYWTDCSYSIWTVIDDSGLITFFNNVAGGSGGATYADDSDIFLSGTTLLQRNSARYGGALYLTSFSYFYFFGETTFASNEATADGGAIRATDYGGVYFRSNDPTIFMENMCGGNGGAISLSNFGVTAMGNVTFSRNSAESSGGAMSISHVSTGPTLTGVTFSGNTADSGGAVYLSAVGTDVYLSTGTEHDNAEYASNFTGCWFEGNSASSTGGAIHSIAGSDYVENTIFIKNSAANGGAIRVSGIISLFNSSFEDNISEDGRGPAMANEGDISKMVAVKFSGNGFYCSLETFQDLNEIDVEEDDRYNIVCSGCNDTDCDGCIVDDKHTKPVCSPLLPHTESGGDITTLETLILKRGYWRATNTSRNILECFNSKACRGGVTGNNTYCYTGYEGPYCAVCSQGYVRTISYRCSKCSSKTSFGPALFAVFGGLAVLMLLFFVYYMIRIERGRHTPHSIDRFRNVLAVQSLKIIIVSWQIVTQFSEITNVVYPPLYRGLLDVIALVNFDFSWILAAGCFDVDFYDGLIAATAGPLAIVALLGITCAIALHRNHGSELGRRIVRRKHINAVILLAVLVYSSSSSSVFRTFVCDSLDDGNEYLRADYRLICTSPKHRAFQIYARCMIAVYPLGIPVLFGILLFRNRIVLKNVALRTYNGELVQQSTSCLWKPYKPSVFYYEVVECGRRLMLTGIMVFIYPNTTAQIAVTLAMAFIFALSSEGLNPYDSRVDTWVARIGHIMVVLTMFVALLTKVDVSGEGTQSQNMFAAILVTAHAAMVLTGVTEAVLLICSVQQNDSPRPRQRNKAVLPVDNFSPVHVRGRESDH